ncbi:hypothetical protein M405DRAFT_896852 [Rhizopogon salebrosus TDB-379]|nr:hypothetical protein M405DRAFT_896852 [Rhizopogon salebrosus TDB-379]
MLDVSDCPSCSNTRSLSDIIWSCAATLFACTWTAIHPNIPGLDDRKLAIMSRRILLMVMALVVPELVIVWAARQFFSARHTANEFNEKLSKKLAQADGDHRKIGEESQFTVTHGFFAWMGGFLLYVNGHPRASLTPKELLHFVHNGSVNQTIQSTFT